MKYFILSTIDIKRNGGRQQLKAIFAAEESLGRLMGMEVGTSSFNQSEKQGISIFCSLKDINLLEMRHKYPLHLKNSVFSLHRLPSSHGAVNQQE